MNHNANALRVVVIGGGASGLCAAIRAASRGASVSLLEAGPRVGRKILASGNGRCNLANRNLDATHYHGDEGFARRVLQAISLEEVLAFFESLGLATYTDEAGRVYPYSNQANAVLDVLRLGLERYGVQVVTDCRVTSIQTQDSGLCVMAGQQGYPADRVILAAGGPAAPKLGGGTGGHALAQALGHPILPQRPALAPLILDFPGLPALKGIRARATLTLMAGDRELTRETGEVLFTEYGLSGICAMALARDVGDAASRQFPRILLDLLCGGDAEPLLRARRLAMGSLPVEQLFTGLLHRRLGELILRALPRPRLADPIGTLTDGELLTLGGRLTGLPLPVRGVCGFDQAQVAAGGVDCQSIDPATLASRLIPGLHITGELLNVDGDCGGYNLYFAWATGLLSAGRCPDPSRSF